MEVPRHKFVALLIAIVSCVGCTSQTASNSKPEGLESVDLATPSGLVRAVIERYQTTGGYTDDGYVKLAYTRAGEEYVDKAPLSVRYQAPNQISVSAYTLRMSSDGEKLRAMVVDRETNNFDGQCLEMPVGNRLTLAELYADSVVAQFAGAGMAGPPPQLELLLEKQPLKAWLQEPAVVSFGDPADIDGTPCERVIIDAAPLQYVIWIDKQERVIRRIEMPWQAISPGIASDAEIASAQLTVEFEGAKFHESLSEEQFGLDLPPLSRTVSSIIIPPPPAPSKMIGREIGEFSLQDSSGRFTVTNDGSDRDAVAMLWFANHPASQQTAQVLQQTISAMPQEPRERSRVLMVMAEPDEIYSTDDILRSWSVGLPWADDVQAVGRDVFQISEAPCLVLLGKSGKIEFFQSRITADTIQALPNMIEDLMAGQSVGRRINDRYVTVRAQYLRAVASNTLSEGAGKRWATIAALPLERY